MPALLEMVGRAVLMLFLGVECPLILVFSTTEPT